MKSIILVPTDFSEATNKSLQHAVVLAIKADAKIILLNICSSDAEIEASKGKLEIQAKNIDTDVEIEVLTRVGSFNDIAVISKELAVDVLFLGTHGATGMQKVTGSNALKIVSKSDIPCVIIQKDAPAPKGYNKIMVPASFHFENKQKIKAVGDGAKFFNGEVCLVYNDVDAAMKTKSLNNLKFMKQHLDKVGVNYTVEVSSGKDYNADVVALAKQIGADLIAIMNMQKDDILGNGLFGKNYEQDMIMNDAKIPVLILNPQNTRMFGETSGGFH